MTKRSSKSPAAPAETSLIPKEIARNARKLSARDFNPFLGSEAAALRGAAFVENKGRASRTSTYLAVETSKAGELARVSDPAAKHDAEVSRWLGIRESAMACRDAAQSDRLMADDAIERADAMLAYLHLQSVEGRSNG